MLYKLAHIIKERFGFIWDFIEWLNATAFSLTHRKQLKTLPQVLDTCSGEYHFRLAQSSDAPALVTFFANQPEEAYEFFKPHDFDAKAIKKVIANKGRHGIVPNFENALKNSCGDYIFFSDQDDIWNINKVNTCILALKDADLVVHNSRILFERDCSKELDFFQWRHSGPGYWKNLYKNTFVGSCMAFRKEVKGYALPFPKHILWHDMWIGLITEKHGVTKFINDQLLYYRRHDGNASTTCSSSSFSRWTQLKYRIQMFYYTLNR